MRGGAPRLSPAKPCAALLFAAAALAALALAAVVLTPAVMWAQQAPSRAPITVAPTPPARPAPEDPDAALAAIDDVLNRFRTAFNALDATAVDAVWPAVDERALARSFRQLVSQDVTFADCLASLTTPTDATVTCRGSIRYVPKIGPRTDRLDLRRWHFVFTRVTDWRIVTVDSRSQ